MIEVKNLTQIYNEHTILNNICFTVNTGEVVALMGPSGSGKSTLLRCLTQLENPSSGEILIHGRPLSSVGMTLTESSPVGVVFQGFNLFPHMTVLQNLTYAPVLKKQLSLDQAQKKAKELLEQVGLSHRLNSFPKTLSGGEKQRVAISRALMLNPKVLLLDEPTSALDHKRTQELAKMIRAFAEQGITSFIVTHEMTLAKELGARLLLLENGELKSA